MDEVVDDDDVFVEWVAFFERDDAFVAFADFGADDFGELVFEEAVETFTGALVWVRYGDFFLSGVSYFQFCELLEQQRDPGLE